MEHIANCFAFIGYNCRNVNKCLYSWSFGVSLRDLEARSDEVLFSDLHASTSFDLLTDKMLHYRCWNVIGYLHEQSNK
jgi:hypothetical protein